MIAIVYILAGIEALRIARAIHKYFTDRSGNSGRANHWQRNPRIDGVGR